MKRIATGFLFSLFQVVTIFTLTCAPVPFLDRITAVYAQDSEVRDDCEDDTNEDGSPRVYKPGCDFNDALTKAGDQSQTPGLVGVIEQFIAAAFGLAAINSINFVQHPMNQIDCPGYMNPDITLRLMQAGSLAYIVGNIQSNQKFKSAAKDAVDIELTPQAKRDETVDDKEQAIKNREFNQKQLDAYMALIKVYEAKVKALETKKTMAMLAEAAYLGALGTEILMTKGHTAKCVAASKEDQANIASISGALTALDVAIKADITPNATCVNAQRALITKVGSFTSSEGQRAAAQVEQMTRAISEATADQGFITKIFQGFLAVFSGGAAAFFLNPVEGTRDANDATDATANTALTSENAGEMTITTTDLSTSCTTAPNPVTTGPHNCPQCLAALAPLAKFEGWKVTFPKICCGIRNTTPTTGLAAMPVPPGKINIEKDVIIIPVVVENSKEMEFLKYATSDLLQQYLFNMIENSKLSREQKVELTAKSLDQLDYFETNFNSIIQSPEFKNLVAEYSKEIGEKKSSNPKKLMASMFSREIFISDANAGGFGELLGLGTKMIALQLVMGNFLRNTALISPQNRMWTFGAMAAANLGVMMFNGKSAKEAKRRLEIVKEEARAFAESNALSTEFDEKLAQLAKSSKGLSAEELAKLNALGQRPGVVTCADPKGNSFVPAQCPSNLRPSAVNFAMDSESRRRLGNSPLGQALPLISDAVAGIGNGSTISSGTGGTASGSLAQLGNLRNGIIKQVDGLAEDFDKDVLSKQFNKEQFKNGSLAANNSRFRSLFNGNPETNGVTKDMLAGIDSSLADIEKLKNENKPAGTVAAYKAPKFTLPKANDFNFDINDSNSSSGSVGSASGSGSSLEDYQVNAGDVNQKSDVSIFRIISNRYLKSYPVLLEEKK